MKKRQACHTLCFLLIASTLATCPSFSFASSALENKVAQFKAAYIYKFTKFVSWPESAFKTVTDPISICIDSQAFQNVYRYAEAGIRNRTAHGKNIRVIDISKPEKIPISCHVIYGSEKDFSIPNTIAPENVLTIADTEANSLNISSGSPLITLKLDRNRIHFDISRSALNTSHLQISNTLLSLSGSRN